MPDAIARIASCRKTAFFAEASFGADFAFAGLPDFLAGTGLFEIIMFPWLKALEFATEPVVEFVNP